MKKYRQNQEYSDATLAARDLLELLVLLDDRFLSIAGGHWMEIQDFFIGYVQRVKGIDAYDLEK